MIDIYIKIDIMKLKTLNGKKEVEEVFPEIRLFVDYILKLDTNIRYNNEQIKNKINNLYSKLKNDDGEYSLSLLRSWLVKNYGFKTNKWGKLEYWLERGWLENEAMEELKKRNTELRQRNRLCEEYWIKKGYSKEEAIYKISKAQSKRSKLAKNIFICSKENLKNNGYSNEQIENICLTPTTVKFWIKKGHSKEEAVKIISDNQKKISSNFSNKRKENPNLYSATTYTQIGYWLNKGFSKEEAKEIISEKQSTFSLEKCIEKYGKERGKEVFTERQKKWQKSLVDNGNLKNGHSKISQELFYKLLESYNIEDREQIYFATKNEEYKINKEGGGIWMYDFADLKNKKIIEFHGDMFHGNPKKYLAEDYPNPFNKELKAKSIWEKDKQKEEIVHQNGFDMLVIWDSEYRWGSKEKVINKCIEFLKK